MFRPKRVPVKKSETEPMAYGFLAGAAVILAALLSIDFGCARAPHVENAPQAARPNVDKLMLAENGAEAGHCTAWKAAENRVFTAGHCCKDGFSYYFADTGEHLTVLADDDKHDVCVLEGKMPGAPVPLASRDPEIGDFVWTAGYPIFPFVVSGGFWSGRAFIDDGTYGVSSAVARPGSSGSPLLDENGKAVGMIVAGYLDSGDNIALSAPIEWLWINLNKAR